MYLCNCHGTTEQDVIDLVDATHSAFVYATICQGLKGSKSCCKCLPRTREVIDEAKRNKARRKEGTPVS